MMFWLTVTSAFCSDSVGSGCGGATAWGADAATQPAAAAVVAAAVARPPVVITPPAGARFLPGQRFDVRVEGIPTDEAATLKISLDGKPLTGDAAGKASGQVRHGAGAEAHVDFTARGVSLPKAGTYHLAVGWGAEKRDRAIVVETLSPPPGVRGARNVILFLGDGMGLAHRTAARVLSRGYEAGRAKGPLAMDTMEATGLVMTSSLNALVTDSAPGMAAYTTGNKGNNNQMGVFPDDTIEDAFDNPRIEYLGAWLRRTRGPGFNMGIVTTSDVADATPAACAVHTASRKATDAIARAYFDERRESGLSVLLGGGRRRFQIRPDGGDQTTRDLIAEFRKAGFAWADDAPSLEAAVKDPATKTLLGLMHAENMTTAFDKIGLGAGYSEELREKKTSLRQQPMLKDMTRAALEVLGRTSPRGFLLVVEGASIDKRSHDQDAERALWDVIELDQAIAEGLGFARGTNGNADRNDDTLVIVTADHETGGMALAGVGNERYQPALLGKAVRDYVATLRFEPRQTLQLFPNYQPGPDGYPLDPDPSRKLIIGWGAGGDRYENFISNRKQREASRISESPKGLVVANPDRDGPSTGQANDNRNVGGRAIPGFLIGGIIENGADRDPHAPGDSSSASTSNANHTATDVPLSASGPGALSFTGTYDNTDTFFKMARVLAAWKPRR